MKVGTDAILLGAWCDVENVERILDVGTGSGVIALLLACRCNAEIDAIEKDDNSALEAGANFNISKYSNHLKIINSDFNDYAILCDNKYDLIVSNPPFFNNDLLPDRKSREIARHTTDLTHYQLLLGVSNLLADNGRFCVVLPSDQMEEFVKTGEKHNLFPVRKLIIHPKRESEPNRINIEFGRNKLLDYPVEEIIIRKDNNEHTEEYRSKVSDYLIRI